MLSGGISYIYECRYPMVIDLYFNLFNSPVKVCLGLSKSLSFILLFGLLSEQFS